MKTERWGNRGAVEIQRLTASKFLPQLSQDAFLLGGWYAEIPRKRMPDLQMSPVLLRLALNAGGAGELRRDFGVVADLGFWVLADVFDDSNSGSHFSSRDSFEHPQTVMKALDVL
jgi:hypothetical protein